MADSAKRRAPDNRDGGSQKKRQKGTGGKWKVPKREGSDRSKGTALKPGDVGIWVTCALHMKGKAAREMQLLFDHYAEKFYAIKSANADADADDTDDDQGDIESAIQKEVGNLKNKDHATSDCIFTEVRIDQECLLFMKCKPPVEPVDFCRRICQDITSQNPSALKVRYLNRLTPVSVMSHATENGVEKGAREALAPHFKLKPKAITTTAESGAQDSQPEVTEEPQTTKETDAAVESSSTEQPATYAIRPSIRNHSILKRDIVIPKIADVVDPQHKVNLGAPDKVVLVEIYQTVCGISVVPGDWEALRKFNLTELYKQVNLQAQDSETKEEVDVKAPVDKPEA